MASLRSLLAALAVLALTIPVDGLAKKGYGKKPKKAPRHGWVHASPHALERDLARLVAARPRLPDGSRVVIGAPRPAPLPRATARAVSPTPRLPMGPAGDAYVAQRRASAVGHFLDRHPPLQ